MLLAWFLTLWVMAAEPVGMSDAMPQPDLGPPRAGDVRDGAAFFHIPLPAIQEYAWRVPMGGAIFIEYAWVIEIVNRGETHRFGFMLWNQGDQSEGRGGIDALLSAGQAGGWRVESDGSFGLQPELQIDLSATESHLEIVVRDAATFDVLFSDSPLLFRIIDLQMRDVTVGQRVSRETVQTAQLHYSQGGDSPVVAPLPKGR